MRYLLNIDARVMCWYEAFAHWIQRWTGCNCFFLSRVTGFLWVIVVGAELTSRTRERGMTYDVWLGYIVALFMLVNIGASYTMEGRMLEKIAQGFGNPRKIDPFLCFARPIGVLISIDFSLRFIIVLFGGRMSLRQFLDTVDIVLYTSYFYFISCDPLPPCVGRIREALRSAGLVPVKAEA